MDDITSRTTDQDDPVFDLILFWAVRLLAATMLVASFVALVLCASMATVLVAAMVSSC